MSRYIDLDKLNLHQPIQDLIYDVCHTKPADVRENVRGEWIACEHDKWMHGTYALRCSQCNGGYHLSTEHHIGTWNFCPNCGADMSAEKHTVNW